MNLQKFESTREALRYYDYRLRELLKTIKGKKKLSGDPRPKRSIASIERSLADIRAQLTTLEMPAIPKKISEARQAELDKLLASIHRYEMSKNHLMQELRAEIKKRA